MPITQTVQLAKHEWQHLAMAHRKRAEAWTVPFRKRRSQKKAHPITDFLFIYYRSPPSQLEYWHPGLNVGLENGETEDYLSSKHYRFTNGTASLAPDLMDASTRNRLEAVLKLCTIVAARPAQFGCFGMHEWAMVYDGGDDGQIRHAEQLPLRMDPSAINAFVENQAIACSHFDAFRFFTPSAKKFNRLQPGHDGRLDNEQCGCLHTNMDLYKLCAQCMPWIGSDLLWRAFEFATNARQLDMQASPYDCTSLGYSPVKIETAEGRLEYEDRQRALSESAKPIRAELITRLERLLNLSAAVLPQSSDS